MTEHSQFTTRLISLSRAGLERTKCIYFAADALVVVTLVAGLLNRFAFDLPSVNFTVVICLATCIAIFLRIKGGSLREWSRRARYTGLLSFAYGREVDPDFSRGVELRFGDKFVRKACRTYDGESFYELTDGTSRERLRSMTIESAFWSKYLYRTTAKWFLSFVVALLIAMYIFFEWLVDARSGELVSTTSRALLLGMSVVFGYDLITRIIAWFSAAGAVENIFDALQRIDLEKEEELYLLFVRYQLTVYSAPLLPTLVYRLRRNALRSAWRERVKEGD